MCDRLELARGEAEALASVVADAREPEGVLSSLPEKRRGQDAEDATAARLLAREATEIAVEERGRLGAVTAAALGGLEQRWRNSIPCQEISCAGPAFERNVPSVEQRVAGDVRTASMPRAKTSRRPRSSGKKPIEQYEHLDRQRVNNPPVGLVKPETDVDGGKRQWTYDPAPPGKAEHASFEAPPSRSTSMSRSTRTRWRSRTGRW